MQPTYIPISTLFGAQTRHTVPLFQRPYVWSKEDQWEPLWEDITGLLERLEARQGEENVASHFLGTIVLDQATNPTGSLPRREVIDGQQRLTTLQLLLKAAEHALEASEVEAAGDGQPDDAAAKALAIARRQIAMLTENPAYSEEVERYKVWPTNEDRAQFQAVMDSSSDDAPSAETSRMGAAYRFFREVFEDYLSGEDQEARAQRFSSALRDFLKVIVLDLDTSDEPQAIFETLNAHGTPLLPADLMKNWLLWEAARQKVDANTLYVNYWRPFDREHKYWRERVGTGHAARARVDTFLQNWLTMETVEVVPAKHLYDRFLRHARAMATCSDEGALDLDELMASIRHFADLFERIDKPSGTGRFARFLERLKVMDVVVFHPLLLFIMDAMSEADDLLDEAAKIIEAFLVRRMVCNYQTRGYGTLALRLLGSVRGTDDISEIPQILKAELIENQGSDSWTCPGDVEFREQWQARRFYGSLRRDRVLMILRALEEHSQFEAHLAEPIAAFDWDRLQVEHIMPQKWVDHWPLPDDLSADDRDYRVHGIGNLTLVSGSLNPTMSNAGWLPSGSSAKGKREELSKHSLLFLNKSLLEFAGDDWCEQKIASRADALCDTALKIWAT